MFGLLKTPANPRQLAFELFGARGVVAAKLSAHGIKDGVGDAPLEGGDFVCEILEGLH